ncbi:MarR family winged helix-turn-helix transcriptional regulator [Planobispora siamensis]|uniref:MarR family transcriptional regulator n=1 Tax=Planobispora siamensis TaxID=936338 RepID=A0A8J3WMI1_9ACTN|nr:MarR family transcriptional regulator [Planobispora siamensis]GIH93497.1 MarR family transcriptional regulator [Planobispora siamensis]
MSTSDATGRRALQHHLGQQLGSRFSTAVVLFHAAAAERIGLNVTDFRCAEVLLRLGPTHPGRLAEATGMSSAATAQVLNRLERAGLVHREPDPADGRRTIVRPAQDGETVRLVGEIFGRFGGRVAAVVDAYDEAQLRTVLDFVTRTAEILEDETAALRRTRRR